MDAKVAVTLPSVETYIKAMGLTKGGSVQKFIDSEIIRLSDPYVPSDTTATRKSVFINTDTGSGKIIYDAYYTNAEKTKTIWSDEKIRFQDAPMRGCRWTLRMWEQGGRERIIREVNNYIKRFRG
jgi:hypothetical protein